MAGWQRQVKEEDLELPPDPELRAFEHELQLLEASYTFGWDAATHSPDVAAVPVGGEPAYLNGVVLPSGPLDALDALLSMEPLPPGFWEAKVAAQAQQPSTSSGHSAGSGLAAPSTCPSGGSGSGNDSSGGVAALPASAAAAHAPGRGKGKGVGVKAAGRYATPEARARKQEQQRLYRQRLKQRQAQQQTALQASEAQLEALRRERERLLEHQAALEKLQEYREQVVAAFPFDISQAAPPATFSRVGALEVEADADARQEEDEEEEEAGVGGTVRVAELWDPVVGQQLAEGGAQPVQRVARALDAAVQDAERSGQRLELLAAAEEEPRGVDRVASLVFSAVPSPLLRCLLLPGDRQLRSLLQSMTAEQFAVRDRGFRHVLQSFLDEWELSGPAGRQRVEHRLEIVWAVRGKASAMLAKLRPDLLCEVMNNHLLPDPPEALDAPPDCCPVHHMLPRVVELLGITPHQRRAILAAWQVYKQRVAAARQMSRSCIDGIQQVGVRQAAGRGAVLPETLSAIMQDYVASFEAAAGLASLPQQEAVAWMQLSLSAYQVLTPLQRSRLVLGCSPYMPDSTQICRLLERQEGRGLRSQPGWAGASAADPGHLLSAVG